MVERRWGLAAGEGAELVYHEAWICFSGLQWSLFFFGGLGHGEDVERGSRGIEWIRTTPGLNGHGKRIRCSVYS